MAGVGELSGKTGGFSTAIKGASKLEDGSSQLEGGLKKAIVGVQHIANGDGTAANPGIAGIATQLSASNDEAAKKLGQDQEKVTNAADKLEKDLQTENTNLVTGLKGIMDSTKDAETKKSLEELIDGLEHPTTAPSPAADAGALRTALETLKTDTTHTLTAAQNGAQAAAAGLNQYVDALTGTASTQSSVVTGLNSAVEGAQALNAGATQLSTGLTEASKQLGTGAKQLSDGATQLDDGTGQLDTGLAALLAGSKTLAGGTAQLSDGASQLADGAQQAADGSVQLSDGLQQFNEQAVQKIVDAFSGNLGSLADKTKAIVQAGKNYNNFCGITSGTEGHVKFIYETDAINKN